MPGTVKSELLPDADRSHKCDCQEKVSWKRNLPLDKSHFITETLNNCPTNAACSIMPEQGLILVYLYWDVFRIVVRCRCTSYYNEFYSAIEKSVYHRLSKLNNNYAEDICWLLSRAYLASFFEIIRCDYDFETAQKCIGILENFFASQEIHC